MKLAEPTKFNRKSGGAKWRDLQFVGGAPKAQVISGENLQRE
jgi:hypothetical protein